MKIKKVLVANRGEIAIRIFRSCVEIGLTTVAIYTYEDRYSQHRYKADESYQVGRDDDPLKPYLDIDEIINVAKSKKVDAIHPGYGFLSENSVFAQKCKDNGIIFIGPDPEVMLALGDKIKAKEIAVKVGIPVIESSVKKLTNAKVALAEAMRIGFPVMLKAASGGGGRGMRVLRKKDEVENAFNEGSREALNAFGDDTMFLEKYVEEPKHIEIQIVGDRHGNLVHLFERDCSVQRRYQKVVEVAPSFGLEEKTKQKIYEYALGITKAVNYNNVGTVEFLLDKNGGIYFIEVNPRIQVEHTVTEMITNIDLIKTQLFIAGGYKLSDKQIREEIGDLDGVANSLNNIGFIYRTREEYGLAIEYFLNSIKIYEEINSKKGLGNALNNAGQIYMLMENYDKAYDYCIRAYEISLESNSAELITKTTGSLGSIFFNKGDYKRAYEFFQEHSNMKDSILNESMHKQITELQQKYESVENQQKIELLSKDKDIQQAEIRKNRFFIAGISAVLLLMLVFSFILYTRFKLIRKQKWTIEEQKKDITDCIHQGC